MGDFDLQLLSSISGFLIRDDQDLYISDTDNALDIEKSSLKVSDTEQHSVVDVFLALNDKRNSSIFSWY